MANRWWPFGDKTPDVSEISPNKVSLTENQLDFLNKMFPGFAEMNEQSSSELLEKLSITQFTDPKRYKELLNNQQENVSKDYAVAAAYAAIYTRISEGRRKIIQEVDRIKNFYLVDVILNQITEDALSPEIGTGYIVNLESDKEEIKKELDYLDERFEFDQMILNITPDLLAYGEYTLATKVIPSPQALETLKANNLSEWVVPNKIISKASEKTKPQVIANDETGIISINDTVDQTSIVALTKDCNIDGYVVRDDKQKIHYREPADFIKFTLGGTRVRVNIHNELGKISGNSDARIKDIPQFVRVGKSVIAPIMSKLRELELLETLVPATKLSKLSSGTLVGVQVPPGYEIEKAMEAAKKVEGILNKKIGVDQSRGELSIENIMSAAGRLKVVPIFGEKGVLSKLDYKSEEPDELLTSINDVRKVILGSVGIPPELVFGIESGSRGEMLKKYARYLRKLKSIQKALGDGLRQIVYIHLANKGIRFVPSDIKVSFYNKLVEIDNLDKLEFMDTVVGMLGHLREFVQEISNTTTNPEIAKYINVKEFVSYLDSQFGVIGLGSLINKDIDGDPVPVVGQDAAIGNDTEQPQDELPLPDDAGELPMPPAEDPLPSDNLIG